jgi:hypothetical protein
MFGLFSLKNSSLADIKKTLMQGYDNIVARVDGDCEKELRGVKVKKNLGSLILKVTDFSIDGYTVHFTQGDICEGDIYGNGDVRYSSEMRYIC